MHLWIKGSTEGPRTGTTWVQRRVYTGGVSWRGLEGKGRECYRNKIKRKNID